MHIIFIIYIFSLAYGFDCIDDVEISLWGNCYNVEETKAASEFTVFNRAWQYIKQIDLNKEDHLSAIIQFNKDPFIPALEAAINYFEDPDVEQYERCAFLFKILDLKKQV